MGGDSLRGLVRSSVLLVVLVLSVLLMGCESDQGDVREGSVDVDEGIEVEYIK